MPEVFKRIDNRGCSDLRRVRFTSHYQSHPLASVLVEMGGTRVVCSVTLEHKVPSWMRAQKVSGGWLTAEYGMLPGATGERFGREAAAGKQGGRTVEIQRLIGRSLRAVMDLSLLDGYTITVDCDVIDADGGTRCASITGAAAALALAMRSHKVRKITNDVNPMKELVAAVSVGMTGEHTILDLNYAEDSSAGVDMNVVMTESGKMIEVQGTAEHRNFSRKELNNMLDLAESGLNRLFEFQRKMLNPKPRHDNAGHLSGNIGSLDGIFDNINLDENNG